MFLEIGNAPNATGVRRHFTYDLDQAIGRDSGWFVDRMGKLLALLRDGKLAPPRRTVLPFVLAGEALRALGQGRTVGKLVLKLPTAPAIRADASYLVTGGTGDVGRALAGWLKDNGAGRVDRAGPPRAETKPTRASRRVAADVTDREALARVIDGLPNLKGVIHAAGIVNDGTLAQLDPATVPEVLAPKIDGARHLDALTRDRALDFFVLVSSTAGSLASPGQAAYASANAWLDALAAARRASGHTATSIAFGPWMAGMYAALNAPARARLERDGFRPMAPRRAVAAFARALADGAVHRLVMDRDDRCARPESPARRRSTTIPSRAAGARNNSAFLRADLEQRLVALLGFPAGTRIEPHRALRDLGLNSLLSVSLRNALAAGYGLDLPATLVFDHPTLVALADHLLGLIVPQEAPPRRLSTLSTQKPSRRWSNASSRPNERDTSQRSTRRPAPGAGRDSQPEGEARGRREEGRQQRADRRGRHWLPLRRRHRFARRLLACADGRPRHGRRPAGQSLARDRFARAPINGAFLDDVEGFDAALLRHRAARGGGHGPAASPAARGHLGGVRARRRSTRTRWPAAAPACSSASATNDYARRVPADSLDRYFGVGSSPAVASGRIAYLLDLRGPCLTLDTACSSSLVAVHYAMRALRDRDCDTAIAGGVSLMLGPELGDSFAESGMLAADGRCKTFDARADGYGRGEGAGMVVLRRLSDAVQAGDRVLAVLRGSAINQDGRSAGLTAPNGPAQTALIKAALNSAGLGPDDIDYVEAHGTGTPLGDPIEWHALAAAVRRPHPAAARRRGQDQPRPHRGGVGHRRPDQDGPRARRRLHPAQPAFRQSQSGDQRGVDADRRAAPADQWRAARRCQRLRLLRHQCACRRRSPRSVAARGGTAVTCSSSRPTILPHCARSPRATPKPSPRASTSPPRATPPRSDARGWRGGSRCAHPPSSPAPNRRTRRRHRSHRPQVRGSRCRPIPSSASAFPLPGAPAPERTLAPDDPLLADTDGLAHLGVLLSLIDERPDALADITFPAALAVSTPRRVRTVRDGRRITLESRTEADSDWTVHLAATIADRPPASPRPSLPTASQDAGTLYERIAAYGFRYGEAARRLSSIAITGDLVSRELAPDDAVSPGAVEAMAQLAYALLSKDAPP